MPQKKTPFRSIAVMDQKDAVVLRSVLCVREQDSVVLKSHDELGEAYRSFAAGLSRAAADLGDSVPPQACMSDAAPMLHCRA